MTEYHDPSGDEQDDVLQPDIDVPGDRDALPAHAEPPLDDLGSAQAAAPPELHFPGDEIAGPPSSADLDPSAPWPDDGAFTTWLASGEPGDVADAAGVDEQLRAAPDGDALPSADELVDWTLRRLSDG